MTTVPVRTLATFAETAKDLWEELAGAMETQSVTYVKLWIAQPKGATAEQCYSHLPKAWRDKCKPKSFGAQFSLAGRIVKGFDKAKADGSYKSYADAVAFVAAKGSLDKASGVLFPATVEKSAPKSGEKSAPTKVKATLITSGKGAVVTEDKFGSWCKLTDELSESDLAVAQMYLADRIAKMQAKATVEV